MCGIFSTINRSLWLILVATRLVRWLQAFKNPGEPTSGVAPAVRLVFCGGWWLQTSVRGVCLENQYPVHSRHERLVVKWWLQASSRREALGTNSQLINPLFGSSFPDYLAWMQDDPLSSISLIDQDRKPCELMIHTLNASSRVSWHWCRTLFGELSFYHVLLRPLYFWRRMKYLTPMLNVAQASPGSQSCWLLHLWQFMLLFVLQVMTEWES